jgi:hypothetical protein
LIAQFVTGWKQVDEFVFPVIAEPKTCSLANFIESHPAYADFVDAFSME